MTAHGTYAHYTLQRCRCTACRAANATYVRQRARRLAVEAWHPETSRYVDAAPVRAHLSDLAAQGMGLKRAAAAAGVAHGTASAIVYGKHADKPTHPEHRPPRHKVRRDIADKLLAVTYQPAGATVVSSVGTARRLQALVAIGWSARKLASRLGFEASNFTPVLHGRRNVEHRTAEAVRVLYNDLWNVRPPADDRWQLSALNRSIRFAQQHGWVPPMAWDDDTIDNPDARPDRGTTERLTLVDQIAELADLGCLLPEIAHRLQRTEKATVAALRRTPDLLRRITPAAAA